jgi:hypothetical protein
VAERRPTRDCTGLEWEALLEAVLTAINPADEDVVGKILGFVEAAARTPRIDWTTKEPYRDGAGQVVHQGHHFVYWLWGLQAGSWWLPERVPRAVLEAFAQEQGFVGRRCEDCRMATAQRLGGGWAVCPVCGGSAVSHKKLSGPPWDPPHIYTPWGGVPDGLTHHAEAINSPCIPEKVPSRGRKPRRQDRPSSPSPLLPGMS